MDIIPLSKFNCAGALLQAAKKHGVAVEMVDEKSQLMIFSKNEKSCYVKRHVVDINSQMSAILTSNKFLTKRLLKKNGIPVPAGFREKKLEKVLERMKRKEIKFPLVVKPTNGCQGGAVTVDIQDAEWLKKAIDETKKYNSLRKNGPDAFLVEEYIAGSDFRFLILDGKILTVLMRKPAYVVGDGKKNIGELINEYNGQPGVAKNQPLCPIVRDYEFDRNLLEQDLSEEVVVGKGKIIHLRKSANVSTGGRSFECLDKVDQKYFALMEKIVKIFGIRFCAVDIIAEDIGKFENFRVIELNDTPGFDIHEEPFEGKPFRVAERLVDLIFS
ncbi:MAG: cyanophycin synthase [uncultured bacterium]|nr:MAG: cyanophycin synthase [uncultured bacterium]